MNKLIKTVATLAFALIGGSLFAYNGGYENSLLTDTTIGGVTYKGYGNNTVTAREESGSTIAANRYAQCKALKSVDLTGVTSIDDAAFAYSALETLTIPSTVSSMGYIAFGGCTNLTSVTFSAGSFWTNGPDANKEPFRDCSKLTTATVPGGVPSWDFKTMLPAVAVVLCPASAVASWQGIGLTARAVSQITFGKNGGSGGTASVSAIVGDALPKISVPTRSGYAFEGYWTTTASSGVKYYNADGTGARVWDKTNNTTLWAKWTKDVTCKITFGKNGGTGGDNYVTVKQGEKPQDVTIPTRSGYTFGGYWTTTAASGVQYFDGTGKATRVWDKAVNATLWAKWTKVVTCKITFGKNGGTGGDNYVTVNQGATPHDVTIPKRSGYTFGGYWTTTAASGVQYFDGTGKATRVWDKAVNATLWAKWTKVVTCKITFGKNGGTGGDNYVTVNSGSKPHDITAPKKSGSTFCGYWTSIQSTGKQYFDANGKALCVWDKTSNATLWAKWSNKITFGKNGGSGGDNYVTAYQGVKPNDITPPTRAGYAFDGYWTTTGAGGVQYFYADGSAARTWDKTANVTLWAKWISGTPRKVTFGLNGGTGKTYVYAVTGKAMPRIGVPTRNGYTFAGYWTTTTASGVKYYNADGTSAKNYDKSGATTLWAKWVKAAAQQACGVVLSRSTLQSMQNDASAGNDDSQTVAWSAGYYRGLVAGDAGQFDILLDAFDDEGVASAYVVITTEDGTSSVEGEASVVGTMLVLMSEGVSYTVVRDEESVYVIQRAE